MGKNRKSKLVLSATVAASALVSTTNVEAAQITPAEKWVKQAENLAGSLKWAISVEGKEGKIPEIPWALFNQTKDARAKALEAMKGLSKSQKTVLEARLQENVDLYISTTPGKVGRVVAYIDAITAGKKIEAKKKALEQKLQKNEIDDGTEKEYHELSWELKKQSILLDRVYGQSTRNVIRDNFKKSAEVVMGAALYPVSIKIELDRAKEALVKNDLKEADKRIKAADEFLKTAVSKGIIKLDGQLYKKLNESKTTAEQAYKTETDKQKPSTSVGSGNTGGGNSTTTPPPTTTPSPEPTANTYSVPGTYGGTESGVQVIEGDVTISSQDVILQNMVIKGNLYITEAVGEGDVRLKNVTVEGQTLVKGGGENSVYFEDSVLATVIVNKNNGAIRIVATGSTRVVEVQLESYVKIEETNLSDGADGFTDVTVSEAVQSTNENLSVQLVGSFETINSRATQVRINLAESTDIRTLVLNAAASVLGTGSITTAEINANGSTISQRPQNIVLDNGVRVEVEGTEIDESVSTTQQTELASAILTPSSVSLGYEDFVAGITLSDLEVTAKIDNQPITLENVEYNSTHRRLTFTVPNFAENIGKTLSVTVTPATDSSKLTGEAKTASTEIKHGFSGRITDVSTAGIAGATIKFREGLNNRDGNIVAEATTDQYGYYVAYVEPGEYTGEIMGTNLVITYLYATTPSDVFNIDQNETAIRTAGSSEVKIMLSWGENPQDLDSHLVGPGGENGFHTFYADQIYQVDGINFVDLDWDDTESYGPETTALRKLTDGRYIFYVHHFYGENTISGSNAKVQVFQGNQQAASHTFTVPTTESSELYWVVFAMDISNNGEDVKITPIDILDDLFNHQGDNYPFDIRESAHYQWYVNPGQALPTQIDSAKETIASAVEGTNLGEYQEGAKAAFQTAIDEAEAVGADATLPQLIKAIKKLSEAQDAFSEQKNVPVTHNLELFTSFLDYDGDGSMAIGEAISIGFNPELNADALFADKELLIEVKDLEGADVINFYSAGEDDTISQENLLLSFNTEADLANTDVVIRGNSVKSEELNEFTITFTTFVTENSSSYFPMSPRHIDIGDEFKTLLEEQHINY